MRGEAKIVRVRCNASAEGVWDYVAKHLLSPMPGLLTQLHVKLGDRVEAGQPLAVVEAMKMENILRAPKNWGGEPGGRGEGRELGSGRGDSGVRVGACG